MVDVPQSGDGSNPAAEANAVASPPTNTMSAAANVPAIDSASPNLPSRNYSWYVLGVLVLVYMLNFIDRQIVSILANDIKADLELDDTQLGFLGGAAFGVFYALFGIPLGRLADNWHRIRLMTIGLSLWSLMTVLSGFARNFTHLSIARFGVGVGEASASPCAYSLLSDYFPKEQRATALAIYSSGLYLGAGFSLFLGGKIAQNWNIAYPGGGPLGLVGWQAAFVAVGVPGLLLALWVASLKEPVRGAYEGLTPQVSPNPFKDFVAEMMTVIPPFTFIGALSRGFGALAVNVAFAAAMAGFVWLMASVLGPKSIPQWAAICTGLYAVFSWATALKERSPATFKLIWGTPAFLYTTLAYSSISFTSYAISFWTAPYVERVFHLPKDIIGLTIGGLSALGGFLGVILGGKLADTLRKTNPAGRLIVVLLGITLPIIPLIIALNTTNYTLFCALYFFMALSTSMALGAAAATTQDLVMPHMRGAATATFFIGTTLVGLGLGPYLVGLVSEISGDLKTGMLALLGIVPFALIMAWLAWRSVPEAEATMAARAKMAEEY